MAKKKTTKKAGEKKASEKAGPVTDSTNTGVTAAAISYTNLPVLLKVCRLCEAKDGPFLNIFDADKVTARKIDTLMPFKIAENDDLPHKICFRCSAKVEEFYEFVQKCINTQDSLNKAMGSRGNVGKTKHRELWEEKLNQSNLTNDDLCNAVIKKAMEGIMNFPLNSLPLTEEKAPEQKKSARKSVTKQKEEETLAEYEAKNEKEEVNSKSDDIFTDKDDEPISSLKKLRKNEVVDDDEPPPKRITRLSNEKKVEVSDMKSVKSVDTKDTSQPNKKIKSEQTLKEESESSIKEVAKEIGLKIKQSLQTKNFSLETTAKAESLKPELEPTSLDIMESVSVIKINGVGVLYQCNLCDRNFLKRDIVITHACAKPRGAKLPPPKIYTPPEPPKIPQTVKYITMNVNKEVNKCGNSVQKPKTVENKQPISISNTITIDDDDDDVPLNPVPAKKPKPKIGPASKVRRSENNQTPVASESPGQSVLNPQIVVNIPSNHTGVLPNITATITSTGQPSVQFPTAPSLNSRYKLMAGPNNTFTLVEDKTLENVAKPVEKNVNTVPVAESNKTDPRYNNSPVAPPTANDSPNHTESSISRPYPVGLIKASSSMTPLEPPPLAFPTPATKKQSYTVVQTGNPSKLLISTKPQPQQSLEETSKKKCRRSRNSPTVNESPKQPYSITLEDTTPPTNPEIFTFINVDPLLEPSYVLPTNNIIQESQISTSTNVSKQSAVDKEYKYKCCICNEKFSREKKLSAHVQSHYEKMDEEDSKRLGKNVKKRSKK